MTSVGLQQSFLRHNPSLLHEKSTYEKMQAQV